MTDYYKIAHVRRILAEMTSSDREQISSELTVGMHRSFHNIIKSIKEIVHFRTSKHMDHEAIRSIIISACCAHLVDLKNLAGVLELYGNQN